MLAIYDRHGRTQSLAWLASRFGKVEIKTPLCRAEGQADEAGSPYYEIVELRENAIPDASADRPQAVEAAATATVTVRDADGAPVKGATIAVYWPGAPAADGIGWGERGVTGLTGAEGHLGLTIGGGAHYDPRLEQGPLRVWIAGQGRSQMIAGLGMTASANPVRGPGESPTTGPVESPTTGPVPRHRTGRGTGHRHLNVTFQQVRPSAGPPDLPPTRESGTRPEGTRPDRPPDAGTCPDLEALFGLLTEAHSHVEKTLPVLQNALDQLMTHQCRGED